MKKYCFHEELIICLRAENEMNITLIDATTPRYKKKGKLSTTIGRRPKCDDC